MKYRFTLQNQIFFAQKLSLLIDSGISLAESLKILKDMSHSKAQKGVFEFLIMQTQQGISLSKALITSHAKFDPLFISLVQTGEYSGSLVNSLQYIYKNLEKRNELQKKVITTMLYPAFILVATISMTLFLVMFIFPKILPLLTSLNIPLPLLTRIVKALYENTITYGLQAGFVCIGLFMLIIFLITKSLLIRSIWHHLLLKIPLINKYIVLKTNASLCSTSEILLGSGVSLYNVHDFSYESIKNLVYKKVLRRMKNDARKGMSFEDSLSAHPKLFPKTMIQLCAIGERTGNLSSMFGHCAKIFEQDLDIFFKRFSAMIEPTLMICMGLIVGSIALSIILPIYEITNHLTHQ